MINSNDLVFRSGTQADIRYLEEALSSSPPEYFMFRHKFLLLSEAGELETDTGLIFPRNDVPAAYSALAVYSYILRTNTDDMHGITYDTELLRRILTHSSLDIRISPLTVLDGTPLYRLYAPPAKSALRVFSCTYAGYYHVILVTLNGDIAHLSNGNIVAVDVVTLGDESRPVGNPERLELFRNSSVISLCDITDCAECPGHCDEIKRSWEQIMREQGDNDIIFV